MMGRSTLMMLAGICLLAPAASSRALRQEPAAVASWRGQQPTGRFAITGDNAESGVASSSKGVRYNAGTIQTAGDGVPGPMAGSATSDYMRRSHTHSGNTAADGNTNLGHEAIAATYEGARAVAGSGVSYMADDAPGAALTGNQDAFRPRKARARGSIAFTDVSGTSAAVSGEGNGPVAMAFGLEVASFARAHRDGSPVRLPRDGHDGGARRR